MIYFYPELENCPHCNSKLYLQKTRVKSVVTMDIGGFYAKEHIFACPCNKEVFFSEELRMIAPENCTFGYDVLVYIGKALFVDCLNEQKIINYLAAQNIFISEREISYLGRKFIIYLALAHHESGEKLRHEMKKRGGYILHVDGTCEGDSPQLFTGLDGISELVLDNIKIPSEKKEVLVPFFHRIKEQYGEPIALVHDMGKGILAAVEEEFPDTPDYICHFHFLRDIGKDLFGKEHQIIYNSLKKHGIRTELRKKMKALEGKFSDDLLIVESLLESLKNGTICTDSPKYIPAVLTSALIRWAFDISQQLSGYGFPFDQPHIVFYQRLKLIHSVLERIMNIHLRNDIKDNRPFFRVHGLLDKIVKDKKLRNTAELMEEKIMIFNKLRYALRIALPEGKKGLNDDGEKVDIKTIEIKVKELRKQIIENQNLLAKDDYQKMIAQIDKYWSKLFADPITVYTPSGPISIAPQRTNNILERLFRGEKRCYRKKSGTISLNKTLKTIIADTPLVRNLVNEEYLHTILNGCKTLEERFSQIDAKIVYEQLKKAQKDMEGMSPKMKKIVKQQDLPQKIISMYSNF